MIYKKRKSRVIKQLWLHSTRLNMEFAMDIQCFMRSSNILEVKELAIMPLVDVNIKPTIYLFKPPYPWKRLFSHEKKTNAFTQRFIHKILYEAGEIPPDQLVRILHRNLKSSKTIFVKGIQKAKFIENLLPDR